MAEPGNALRTACEEVQRLRVYLDSTNLGTPKKSQVTQRVVSLKQTQPNQSQIEAIVAPQQSRVQVLVHTYASEKMAHDTTKRAKDSANNAAKSHVQSLFSMPSLPLATITTQRFTVSP